MKRGEMPTKDIVFLALLPEEARLLEVLLEGAAEPSSDYDPAPEYANVLRRLYKVVDNAS